MPKRTNATREAICIRGARCPPQRSARALPAVARVSRVILEEALRDRRSEIVAAFVQRSRAAVPDNAKAPAANIVDHVPQILEELAAALESHRTSLPPVRAVAQQHAATRSEQGMDVRTLVREYGILRTCVIDVCGYPTAAEHAVLDRFFNVSIADAVETFAVLAEKRSEQRRQELAMLAGVGAVLAETAADPRQALQRLADLCVPRLADCCSIYLRAGDQLTDLTITHRVPEKAALVRELYERFPLPPDAPHGFPAALRTGRPELVAGVKREFYTDATRDPERMRLFLAIGAVSWLVVPLSVDRMPPLAVMALFNAESGRDLTDDDMALAQEIARRAALVLDHARLFDVARRERARAEEATRAKDDFLAVLSHELRTPLNSILGWSRLLRAGTPPPEKVSHALEVIERNAEAQSRLIADLLDVSRIVTGNVRLELGSVDIGNTVEMAVEAITPAAMAKNIQIVSKLEADAIVRGDGPRLQQVVWNLVSNAVKFTPKNGKVEVRLRRASSDVEIVFQDSGAGISAEALPYVFERFRQEDASVVRAFGGLGLGLSIARHLVELHGGTITASSPGKGQGSTFTVRIPLSPVATTAITRPAMHPQEHASRDLDAAKVAGMRVLVVEDEPDARELLAELLGSCGVRVTMASSVAEALAAFQRDRPEVILSDIGMPGEDGYALATKIRALPDDAGGNTPMIALTAFAGPQDRTRAIVGGFNAHVAKPVEPSELLDLLGTMRLRRG